MPDIISRIRLGQTPYDIRDTQAARASDLALKQDALTAGNGIAIDNSDIIRTTGIPFGTCDSTSTSKVFTATVPGIYKLEDGVCCIIKNGVVTSESGFTLNVNGLGAKPSYSNMATGNPITPTSPTRDTTIFNINYAMLFIYTTSLPEVPNGAWICYRGYDANTNTIGYQLRHNSSTLPASDKFYRYRLLFTSADGTKYVPANTSTSTNATSSRTVNQRPINPFGEIVYYSSTSSVNAGANPAATVLWDEYVLSLGYSFNRTGAALVLTYPKPVYIKCAPQTDGSAIIDEDTPYVQELPSTNDGKIYVFLGIAYSATNIELLPNHPVYYHDGIGIRIWTGKNITKVSELTNDSGFITSSSLNGLASTSYVDTKVAGVVNSAPETLDTLKELATALGNDPNFATTIATQLGNKVDKETGKGLSTNDYTTVEKTKLAELENYDDSALQTAIDGKVDKEHGKSLMSDAEHTKLAGIAAGAEVNVQANWTQTNTSADDYIKNKPNLATVATSGSYDDLSDKPIYIVTLSIDNNDQITSDKDFDEISEAIQDGKLVIAELSKSISELSSYKQSFRHSAFILSQDINAIGFTALGVGSNSSITTLGCVKSGTETIWSIGDIIIPRGVRLSGSTYNTNINDGYIRLDDVLQAVAITGSYNDLTDRPTIPTSADIDAAKPFIITLSSSDGGDTISCNKTNAEIYAASQSGRDVIVYYGNYQYRPSEIYEDYAVFTGVDWDQAMLRNIFEINTNGNILTVNYSSASYEPNLTFDNVPTQNSNNPVKSGGVYSALLGKQNKSIEMYAAYETLLSALTGTSYENPVTLTGTALEQYNDLVNKYTDGNYSFLFLGTPLVTDSETLGNIGAMTFNILYGGNSITDSISSFTINKQGDNYWVENTSRSIQVQLVSGTNIKTINSQSLLGSGNLTPNDIGAATISDVNTAVSNLVDSAPTTLNTLNELATALGNDPNFATTVTNKIAALLVHVGSVAGKLYRNNVAGSGNFTVTGNSGCIPNLTAGTFLVSIYAKSATQSYTFRFNFGSSVTYDLSTTNGEISDVRQITIPSSGTFSGLVLNGSVASGTILYVVLYNYLTPISTVGPAAVTNRYADLDGTPTIPTVNNGTLTIQKNGTTVGTFTANQSSSTTANITVPTTASDVGAISTSHPANAITSAKIVEWNGKEDKQVVRLNFEYNHNTGVITFTDSDGNSLTHSEVRMLLNDISKDVRLFDTGSDITLFDMSVTKGCGDEDEWGFSSFGGAMTWHISLLWSNNSITVLHYRETILVETSTTINNKNLASNITLNASDVGAMSTSHAANSITSNDINSWNAKADVVTLVTVSGTGAVTLALDANKFYKFGTLTSLTLTLNSVSNGLGIYAGKFTASSNGCTLSVPATVTESIDNPSITANGTYEFNIMDNVLLMVQI